MDILEIIRVRGRGNDIAWFTVFFLSGLFLVWLAVVNVLVFSGLVAALAILGVVPWAVSRARRIDLELWQWLLLTGLSGYMLLNYGFENLAIRAGGVPLIVSYGLMYSCLALALLRHPNLMIKALKEPAMICLLILMFQVFVHLIVDLPRYGLWAIRDSTMVLDGIFLALGLLWAMRRDNLRLLMHWLMVFFIVNLIYSYTLPWADGLQGISPKSGVFNQVALIGNYRGNVMYLLLGGLFCLLLANYVVRWPRWVLMLLAVGQICGLAIEQARAMYISFFLALIVLAMAGKGRDSLKLILILCLALIPVVFLTITGIEIQGRVGTINLDFLGQHMKSITGARDTPGSTNEGRVDWYEQALQKYRQHPWIGVGFGQPLLDVEEAHTGAPIRMPHNASLSILVRLGVIGFIFWVLFNLCVVRAFVDALWRRRRYDTQAPVVILWLFLAYLVFMISISVEAELEFPSGAVPFYFFVGLALGLIRFQFSSREIAGFATDAQKT